MNSLLKYKRSSNGTFMYHTLEAGYHIHIWHRHHMTYQFLTLQMWTCALYLIPCWEKSDFIVVGSSEEGRYINAWWSQQAPFPFRAIQASVLVTVLRGEQGLGHADLHLFIIWTFCVILQPSSLHGIHHWLAMCSCLWPLQVAIDYWWYHMVWHKQYFLFSNRSIIVSIMR